MPRPAYVAMYAAVLFAAYAGWLLFGSADPWTVKVVINLESVLVVAVAGVICGLAARPAQGRARAAWLTMTVGFAGATAAEALWAYNKLVLNHNVFPGPADGAYLMFLVSMCAALLLFPSAHSRRWRGRLFLDGLVMAGSLLIVSWLAVMEPIYNRQPDGGLRLYVALAYPVLNMATLTVAAVVLARSAGNPRVVLALMTLGLACMTLAESAFAYISVDTAFSGHGHYLLDIFWTAGVLLITVAAAKGRHVLFDEQADDQMPGWVSIWLPFAPLMLAGLALAAELPRLAGTGLVIPVGVILLVAVLVRQYLAVSEDRRLLSAVEAQSLHDPLTGLPNRVLFHDRLNHAMQQLRARNGQSIGVLAVDLDDFKLVNDTLGHAAGDELLVAVADRLRATIRTGDTVSRLGGDEFGIILEGPADSAEPIAQQVVMAFDKPFVVDGRVVVVRPSVGLAVAQAVGPNSDLEVDDLLKRADMAMYAAKRSRADGERSRLWSTADKVPSDKGTAGAGAAAVTLVGELHQALDRREFTLVYQPKFSLETSAVVGVEALLRWPKPGGELLGPDEFLPLVRRYGMIGPVTDFVLTRALDDAAHWYAAGAKVPVAINLFPPSLAVPNLPDRISRELTERGLSPSALTVEITEDMVLDDIDRTCNVLSELRSRGILVAIDDFGSGYSALSYLRDLPVDEVKLGKEFIAPIAHDPRAAAVVRAVIDVARVLCLTTVAEGVEDIETVRSLREFGCDYVQGYFYSPPLTAEQVLEMASREVPA